MTGLAAKIHNRRNQTYVDAIQEVAVTFHVFLVRIVNAPDVNFPDSVSDQSVDGAPHVAFVIIPIFGIIVEHAVGNDTDADGVTQRFLYFHQAVHGVIESGVTTHNHNSLITVVDQHSHQPLHG